MTTDMTFLVFTAFICFVIVVALVGIVVEIRSDTDFRGQEMADAYRRGWRDGRESRATGPTQRPYDWSEDVGGEL
jgi:hypothetical protein